MKERPIIFSAPMVRALLDGSKTQTRRVVKLSPAPDALGRWECTTVGGTGTTDSKGSPLAEMPAIWHTRTGKTICCPYGQPIDRLWVRETWLQTNPFTKGGMHTFGYRASDAVEFPDAIWKPSIHMPRAASRITLEIVRVRVERPQDISEADAIAEGCAKNKNGYYWGGPHAVSGRKQMASAISAYRDLFESINGDGSWDANPLVWVVEFKVVKQS